MFHIYAGIDDRHIRINPFVVDTVDVDCRIAVGEDPSKAGGLRLRKSVPDVIGRHVFDPGVPPQSGDCLGRDGDRKTLQGVLVNKTKLSADLIGDFSGCRSGRWLIVVQDNDIARSCGGCGRCRRGRVCRHRQENNQDQCYVSHWNSSFNSFLRSRLGGTLKKASKA
ncbi:MAG: hypothetical protein ACD_75C02603G0004 [uncultured bacterium]|nr:MAG: hypothetical protein ACD_75C02603G0004 [uncultured bacterium]